MKIGVYVGSFNPVHKGHIKIANHLVSKKYVDKVIFIPTYSYWDKCNLIDIKDRINMLKLYENENIIVNSNLCELEYTYLILDELQKKYKDDSLYLIIGSDNLEKFHLWKNVEKIYNYNILVIKRGEYTFNSNLNKDNFKVVNDFKPVDISSTDIRKNINDKEFSKAEKLVGKNVLKYILEHKIAFK